MIQLASAVSTSDTIRYVNPYDDAIDYAASDLATYYRTFDLSALKFVEGKVPTYFTLRPCSQAEVRRANVAVAAKTPDLHNRVAAIGGELLRVGLLGAENLAARGDSHRWPQGAPDALFDGGLDVGGDGGRVELPAPIQEALAVALYRLTLGPEPAEAGGLDDEGKSRSPSFSTEGGSSRASGSSAKTATPRANKSGAAPARRK